MKKKKDDWVAGYYCAVAMLLRKEGCASTEINELFRDGANIETILSSADETDLRAFRDAGLLAANAQANRLTPEGETDGN